MPKNIQFQIHHMVVDQFATLEDPKEKSSTFSVSVRPGCNYGLRAVAISVSVQFISEDRPFLVLETNSFYQISPESWTEMTEKDSSKVVIPKPFIESLVQISISQTRGALFVKTENTPFSKFFLPIVNVGSFEISDLVITPDGLIEK